MEETRNEIKKVLYKEKPIAVKYAQPQNKSFAYKTQTSLGEILFDVPISDMGESLFDWEMPAQLLIRWMVEPKHTT